MNRTARLLCLISFFVVATGVGSSEGNDETKRRPNIIFILLDNVGKDWIRCYGSQENETPNIDRLCYTGMKFRHFYVTPVCSTSRTMLLTGRYPFRTGWHTHHDTAIYGGGYLDWNREVTFARILRDAGYRTSISGKWQINDLFDPDQTEALAEHGFQEHCIWPEAKPGLPAHKKRYWDAYILRDGKRIDTTGQFGPDVFTDYSIDFIKRNRDRPFLLYQSAILTHIPVTTTPHHRDPDATPREKFAGMLRYADHLIGRIVRALDEYDLRENTLLFIATDNGTDTGTDQGMPQSLGGRRHGRISEEGIYSLTERGINMPLIVNCPGWIKSGAESDALLNAADVLPTLADLAGADLPEHVTIDGKSFASVLRDQDDRGWKRPWTFTQYADMRAVRDDRFKLYSTGNFFDLAVDPLEKIDLGDAVLTQADALVSKRELEQVLAELPRNAEWPWTFRSISARKMRSERDVDRRERWVAENHPPPKELAPFFVNVSSSVRPQEAQPPQVASSSKTVPDAKSEASGRREPIRADRERRVKRILPASSAPTFEQLTVTRRDPITRRQFRIKNETDGSTVDAIMLVPDGDGPFAGVVIPQRNDQVDDAANFTLPKISWALAGRGLVTLTVLLPNTPDQSVPPRRSQNPSDRSPARPDEPIIDEAPINALSTAHAFLQRRAEIYPQRIGVFADGKVFDPVLITAGLREHFACIAFSVSDVDLADRPTSAELISLAAPRPLLFFSTAPISDRDRGVIDRLAGINQQLGYRDRVALIDETSNVSNRRELALRFFEWWLQEK